MDKRKVVMESLRGTACGSLKVVQTLLRTCGILEDLQEAVNDYLNRSAGCRGGWVKLTSTTPESESVSEHTSSTGAGCGAAADIGDGLAVGEGLTTGEGLTAGEGLPIERLGLTRGEGVCIVGVGLMAREGLVAGVGLMMGEGSVAGEGLITGEGLMLGEGLISGVRWDK